MADQELGFDSDAPEEFTSQQGMDQDKEIRQVRKENKARVVRERKERHKQWAQKLTPRPQRKEEDARDKIVTETHEVHEDKSFEDNGMLPDDIVKYLAAREKKVFTSDSEDEKPEKNPAPRKKRAKKSGLDPVILSEIAPPLCVQNSLDFLKKRKMQVPRSSAVLHYPDKALRRISKSGLLL